MQQVLNNNQLWYIECYSKQSSQISKTSIHIGNKRSICELLMSYGSGSRYVSSNYGNRSFGS
ncbi:MAG TPA: hypothetical protein VH796_07380, partial [Nitrososphaeraceae archaeon]